MAGWFDGFPDLFTDPATGFGESIIYTPADAPTSPITISAIWSEVPVDNGLSDDVRTELHIRSADVPEPKEGDRVERVASGATRRVTTPIRPDGAGMIALTLEKRDGDVDA